MRLCILILTPLVLGAVAGWFTRGSALRALAGGLLAIWLSSAIGMLPHLIFAFRLWLDIPQEVSLIGEFQVAAMIPVPLAVLFTGLGWLIGFGLWRAWVAPTEE